MAPTGWRPPTAVSSRSPHKSVGEERLTAAAAAGQQRGRILLRCGVLGHTLDEDDDDGGFEASADRSTAVTARRFASSRRKSRSDRIWTHRVRGPREDQYRSHGVFTAHLRIPRRGHWSTGTGGPVRRLLPYARRGFRRVVGVVSARSSEPSRAGDATSSFVGRGVWLNDATERCQCRLAHFGLRAKLRNVHRHRQNISRRYTGRKRRPAVLWP